MHGKTDQSKPKFGIASNVLFMLHTAWRVRRSVLWLCLAQIGLGLANSLLGLFVAPQVLSAIERAVPSGYRRAVHLRPDPGERSRRVCG